VADIEIGQGKDARAGVSLDDLSIVPARRTRDADDVDLSWKIDAYRFPLPMVATGLERVLTVEDALAVGARGALPMVDLDAVWATRPDADAVAEHIGLITAGGVRVAASVSPKRATVLTGPAIAAEVDVLAILGGVVSAEHVSSTPDVLNLKTFIRELEMPVIVGGCASYSAALHLMRTGAAGVVVGVDRPELGVGVPLATAVADARAARVRHLDETGVYCHLIARGPVSTGADIAKVIACGADAVMVDTPVALGEAPEGDPVDHLRRAMALCGYTDVKDFQKAEVVVR
jgi:IMP dehydrogenase